MKKHPCYLLALLLLLSACNTQGKLICNIKYLDPNNGNIADTTCTVYVLPASKGKNDCIAKYYEKVIAKDFAEDMKGKIRMFESVIASEKRYLPSDVNEESINNSKEMIKYSEEGIVKLKAELEAFNTKLILMEDTCRTEIKNFKDNGIRKKTDQNGSCLFELPHGNYIILIHSNYDKKDVGLYKDGYYYTTVATIEAGKENIVKHTCNFLSHTLFIRIKKK
jgi:hypothetical protein